MNGGILLPHLSQHVGGRRRALLRSHSPKVARPAGCCLESLRCAAGIRRAVLPFFAGIGARPAKLAKRLRMEGTTRRVRSASSAAGEYSTYLCDAFMRASHRDTDFEDGSVAGFLAFK